MPLRATWLEGAVATDRTQRMQPEPATARPPGVRIRRALPVGRATVTVTRWARAAQTRTRILHATAPSRGRRRTRRILQRRRHCQEVLAPQGWVLLSTIPRASAIRKYPGKRDSEGPSTVGEPELQLDSGTQTCRRLPEHNEHRPDRTASQPTPGRTLRGPPGADCAGSVTLRWSRSMTGALANVACCGRQARE